MFSLDGLELRYDPFPIGAASSVFDAAVYADLVESYPPVEYFAAAGSKVGHKFTLSEKHNRDRYESWIREHPAWRELHREVKNPEFVAYVLGALEARNINLGIRYKASWIDRVATRLKSVWLGGSALKVASLNTRFEFSMLPAHQGCVMPHTDNASKIVTLVVSMAKPGEWNAEHGGATEVSRPKDPARLFNRMNRMLEFDEIEPIGNFPFVPNAAVVFVKTFNSWHCVRPMTASEDENIFRRTLTINIEVPE